jgi:hypothetical protein
MSDKSLRDEVIEECAQAAMNVGLMIPMGQVDASEFCDVIQDGIIAAIRALKSTAQQSDEGMTNAR